MTGSQPFDPAALTSVSFDGVAVTIIDQTALPERLSFVRLTSVGQIVAAIRSMAVRGAPAIGIAGAYGVALAAQQVAEQEHGRTCTASAARRRIEPHAEALRAARPTAVNLAWAVDRVIGVLEDAGETDPVTLAALAHREADAVKSEDEAACRAMAEHAQVFFGERTRVLTHCNTGLLCTGGIGTALGAIRIAHERGAVERVAACETRPLLQGARLTAWELGILGVPYDVIVDAAAAGLVARGELDLVIVGADRIAANGDTANKVGTYAHALAARAAGIPFVVVAPTSTIDPDTPDGPSIIVEEREPSEVRSTGDARNPAFDVTPAGLITAIVTEDGAQEPPFRFVTKRVGPAAGSSVPSDLKRR